MFEYIIEIYDKRYHVWVEDFRTRNSDIMEDYFNNLLKIYNHDKGCVRVITHIFIDEFI